jgi:CRP-like cAMP-binding protein
MAEAQDSALQTEPMLLQELSGSLRKRLAVQVNVRTLQKITFFHGLHDAFCVELAMQMRTYYFPPGEVVIAEGDRDTSESSQMFFICRGQCEVTRRAAAADVLAAEGERQHEQQLAVLGEDEYFGETELLSHIKVPFYYRNTPSPTCCNRAALAHHI